MARILVAEDSADIADVLQIGLTKRGYEVVQARNGHEAVQAALTGTIDLAILDIRMPEMDGVAALRQIRAAAIAQFPVILLTANITPAEMARGYASGANAYIIKPFHLNGVVQEIETLLPKPSS